MLSVLSGVTVTEETVSIVHTINILYTVCL